VDVFEIEALGPTVRRARRGSVEHLERWHLFGDVPAPARESDVVRRILPRAEETEP
jgi:hypothetical protein